MRAGRECDLLYFTDVHIKNLTENKNQMLIILATGIGIGMLYITYKKIDKKRKEEAAAREKQKKEGLEK